MRIIVRIVVIIQVIIDAASPTQNLKRQREANQHNNVCSDSNHFQRCRFTNTKLGRGGNGNSNNNSSDANRNNRGRSANAKLIKQFTNEKSEPCSYDSTNAQPAPSREYRARLHGDTKQPPKANPRAKRTTQYAPTVSLKIPQKHALAQGR